MAKETTFEQIAEKYIIRPNFYSSYDAYRRHVYMYLEKEIRTDSSNTPVSPSDEERLISEAETYFHRSLGMEIQSLFCDYLEAGLRLHEKQSEENYNKVIRMLISLERLGSLTNDVALEYYTKTKINFYTSELFELTLREGLKDESI